jgi:anti-sigma B factor antagonist
VYLFDEPLLFLCGAPLCDNRRMAESASPLELTTERGGTTAVVRLSGKLVAGVGDSLYQEIARLLPDCRRIVLDLTGLTHMDSLGLGTLVRIYVTTKAAGCDLQLLNLGARIRKLLDVTRMLSVFTVCGENDIRFI